MLLLSFFCPMVVSDHHIQESVSMTSYFILQRCFGNLSIKGLSGCHDKIKQRKTQQPHHRVVTFVLQIALTFGRLQISWTLAYKFCNFFNRSSGWVAVCWCFLFCLKAHFIARNIWNSCIIQKAWILMIYHFKSNLSRSILHYSKCFYVFIFIDNFLSNSFRSLTFATLNMKPLATKTCFFQDRSKHLEKSLHAYCIKIKFP